MPKIKDGWWVMSLQDRRLLFGDRIHAVVVVNYDHETGAAMQQITRAGGQVERLRNNDLLRNEQLDAELGLEPR
jgi:ribosomal protein L15